MDSFGLSCDDAQDWDQLRQRMKGGTDEPEFPSKMANKTACVCVLVRGYLTRRICNI